MVMFLSILFFLQSYIFLTGFGGLLFLSHTPEISETSLTYSESSVCNKLFAVVKLFAIDYSNVLILCIIITSSIIHLISIQKPKMCHLIFLYYWCGTGACPLVPLNTPLAIVGQIPLFLFLRG